MDTKETYASGMPKMQALPMKDDQNKNKKYFFILGAILMGMAFYSFYTYNPNQPPKIDKLNGLVWIDGITREITINNKTYENPYVDITEIEMCWLVMYDNANKAMKVRIFDIAHPLITNRLDIGDCDKVKDLCDRNNDRNETLEKDGSILFRTAYQCAWVEKENSCVCRQG